MNITGDQIQQIKMYIPFGIVWCKIDRPPVWSRVSLPIGIVNNTLIESLDELPLVPAADHIVDLGLRPALLPMETLTKDDARKCDIHGIFSTIRADKSSLWYDDKYTAFQLMKLMSLGYDVFDLIAAGQAVDKLKLKENKGQWTNK